MFVYLKGVLDSARLQEVQALLAGAEFVAGQCSAGKEAAKVKQNQELAPNNPLCRRLDTIVMSALLQHPDYQAAALPLKVATAFYVRYQPGMQYDFHVDDPVMGPMAGRYRSDISTTVFLNGPDEYEGGELVIRNSFGEKRIKGAAGDAVLYASGTWHKVNPVHSGARLAAVTWAQSLVKSAEQRELLYQLAQAREGVMEKMPQSREAENISSAYANLLRMWSEV